jgi:integrase
VKGGRSRIVPLWWDAGTLRDVAAWKAEQQRLDAALDAPFVGSLRPNRQSAVLSRHTLRRRCKTACRVLGLERLQVLTIHHGRHTFISHALAGDRKLAEVRDTAVHANVSITSAYLQRAFPAARGIKETGNGHYTTGENSDGR